MCIEMGDLKVPFGMFIENFGKVTISSGSCKGDLDGSTIKRSGRCMLPNIVGNSSIRYIL